MASTDKISKKLLEKRKKANSKSRSGRIYGASRKGILGWWDKQSQKGKAVTLFCLGALFVVIVGLLSANLTGLAVKR